MSGNARKVTIEDISRAAGASRTAVSFVLSGSENARHVSLEKRERILDAAVRLGYVRNSVATALQRGYSDAVVLLVVTWELATYHSDTVMSISRALAGNGLFSILHLANNDSEARSFLRSVSSLNPYGMLLLWESERIPVGGLAVLKDLGVPVIDLMPDGSLGLPSITEDREQAFFHATNYLIEMAHRDIAMIVETRTAKRSTQPKVAGYLGALEAADLRADRSLVVNAAGITFADGRKAIARLIHQHPEVTAVLCINDQMALGVVAGARDLGLEVPRDLSVVGYGAAKESTYSSPELTTLALAHGKIADLAVGSLLRSRTEAAYEPESMLVPMELVVRGSTASASS